MSLKWFVIHAYSGYENQVKKTLLERIEMQGMGDKFGKILLNHSLKSVCISSSSDCKIEA